MTAYTASLSEGLATDDTFGYLYTAVRQLTDTVGRDALGYASGLLMFPTAPYTGGLEPSLSLVPNTTVLQPSQGVVGSIDAPVRQVQAYRQDTESLTTLDTVQPGGSTSRSVTDSLTLTDTVVRQQFTHHLVSDTIGPASAVLSWFVNPSRHRVESVGPASDVAHRIYGALRSTPSEHHTTSDSIRWTEGIVYAFSETHATGDSVVRKAHWLRPRSEVLSASDIVNRLVTQRRTSTEQLNTVDHFARSYGGHRLLVTTLTTTDAWRFISLKPRHISDTLITSDAITLETLPGAIMGYIWVDAQGNVAADMPDWGWVLREGAANVMSAAPVFRPLPITIDLTREK